MTTNIYNLPYICPKCGENFEMSDSSIVCKNRHSFDRSREGYYNLLLGNTGGVHGDNREMVLARRAFLSGGYYAPLCSRMSALVLEYTESGGTVLDAGCGEGYYTDSVERSLRTRDTDSRVLAFDISKDAVARTAKRNPNIHAVVAGSYHMPIATSSVDTVINTFSPMATEEVLRVLHDGGRFILAVPDEEHLFELKALIYDNPYKNTLSSSEISGFRLLHDERLKYPFALESGEAVRSLFMMTPYAYRTGARERSRIDDVNSLRVTADFHIYVYEKKRL